MTIIITDLDDQIPWVQLPVPPGFVPPSVRQLLAKGFTSDSTFFVCDGKPFDVWIDMDCAYDYSAYPVREVHPFYPVFNGMKITEPQFRTLVKAMHCIAD
jgi:hypothetical protein